MKQFINFVNSNIGVILTIVIIIFVIVSITSRNIGMNKIAKLNDVIDKERIHVAILTFDNSLITSRVDSLKILTLNYKDSISIYKNKLKTLQIDYKKFYNEVYTLNDSDSYIFFSKFISEYKK